MIKVLQEKEERKEVERKLDILNWMMDQEII